MLSHLGLKQSEAFFDQTGKTQIPPCCCSIRRHIPLGATWTDQTAPYNMAYSCILRGTVGKGIGKGVVTFTKLASSFSDGPADLSSPWNWDLGGNISFPEFPSGFVLILLSHLTSFFCDSRIERSVRVLTESHIGNSLFLQIENMQRGIFILVAHKKMNTSKKISEFSKKKFA